MLNEILMVLNQELYTRKLIDDRRMSELDALNDKCTKLESEKERLEKNIDTLHDTIDELDTRLQEAGADGRIDWKRRYEKLTGHHGRTVDELRRELAGMEAEILRLQSEIDERAEKHINTRTENMKLWVEHMKLLADARAAEQLQIQLTECQEENEKLWCENQLLRAALVKADPEEAMRYAY